MSLFSFPQQFPPVSSVTENITALAGGGQAGATVLVARYNSVTVVATAADSVILPPYLVDLPLFVANDSANPLAVFPYANQMIGTAGLNASVTVPAGKTAMFVGAGTAGKWRVIVSA
jgi:hypothetical protein